jgi:acyl-CoA synthetase (AMP-forming)/AMP-acid ligase II
VIQQDLSAFQSVGCKSTTNYGRNRKFNFKKRIREKSLQLLEKIFTGTFRCRVFRPKVFSFYLKHDIELCSGFGMTEATGGITMTPPGRYVKGTVGKPLPGVYTKFAENNEML